MNRCMTPKTLSLLLLVGAVPASVAQAADGENGKAGGVYEASCVIRIGWEPELVPLSIEVVEAILNSTGVSRQAAREVLGSAVDAEGFEMWINLVPLAEAPGKLVGRLEIGNIDEASSSVKPAAEPIMHEICERLRHALEAFGESDARVVHEERERSAADLEAARGRLNDLRERRRMLLNEAGQSDLSRDHVLGRIEELNAQKEDIGLELVGQRARQEAIERRVAQVSEGAEARRNAGDAVTAELQKVVEIREAELKNRESRFGAGGRGASGGGRPERKQSESPRGAEGLGMEHSLERREALAMARAELARHRQEVAHDADAQLAELTHHLAELDIEGAEAEARLRFIESRLDEIRERGLLALADQYESLETDLELAAAMVDEATRRLHESKHAARRARTPNVNIVGGL